MDDSTRRSRTIRPVGGEEHREIWEIEPVGKVCRLTVSIYEVALDCATMRSIVGGLPFIVSGLKTLLETGKPLPPSR